MKAPFRLPAIFCVASACLLIVRPAVQAGYTVTLQEVGPDVVATGSGALDVTGLIFHGTFGAVTGVEALSAVIIVGPTSFPSTDQYFATITGPTSFGAGGFVNASDGGGDLVGIGRLNSDSIVVPEGYVSGSPLSSSSTFGSHTLGSIGLTPGTYTWTWGTGVNQNFTLQIIGAASMPDSGSSLGLLLVAVNGLFGISRFRCLRLA